MNNKDRRHHELMAKLEEIVRLLQLTRAPLNRQEQPFSLQKQYTQTPLSPPLGQKIPLEPHEHLSRSPVTEHPAEPKAAEETQRLVLNARQAEHTSILPSLPASPPCQSLQG